MSRSSVTPWLTLLLAGVMLTLFLSADAGQAIQQLAYQRSAIGDGELWRLFTGHLVHYSPRHLVANVVAFAAVGTLAECLLGHAGFARLCLALATFIGVVLLLWVPAMHTYAGISGINYGLLVFLGVRQWPRVLRAGVLPTSVGVFAAVIIVALLLWQQRDGGSSLVIGEFSGVRVAWQAHLAGMSAAALLAAQRDDRLRFPWPRR